MFIFPQFCFSGFGCLGNIRKSTPATNGEPPKHPDGGRSAISLPDPVQLFRRRSVNEV